MGEQKLTLANSPLINYALMGLDHCWLSDEGRWSHCYHLDGRDEPNESRPESDVFYSLNVLLGYSRVRFVPAKVNVRDTFVHNVSLLKTLPVPKYSLGVALWASAELDIQLPGTVVDHIRSFLFDKENWRRFRAQDLGMILCGVASLSMKESKGWYDLARDLATWLFEQYRCPSGLFLDSPTVLRGRFSSFATNTYLTLGCYVYGEISGDSRFIELANLCTRKLISLQGPNGEWPWFFDSAHALVLDFYEVYSVHQYGMAPAFLAYAERHGVGEARPALIKGFNWVFGKNQLSRPMLVPRLNLTIRSQLRKSELQTKSKRMLRALTNALMGRNAKLIDPNRVGLRLECRSYELGWILWSFGHRDDLADLTYHEAFSRTP